MEIRNLRQVIREKNLDISQIAHETGVQASTLELIMIGVYCPSLELRIRICEAIDEPFDNEIFETGGLTNLARLG